MNISHRSLRLLFVFFLFVIEVRAQHVPSPKEHFGFNIGDDYLLTNYTQTEAYFQKVAAASNRVQLSVAGKTSEGRNQYLIVVSAPENLAKLDTYRQISQTLARAEVSEAEAKRLIQEGKPVVWIDGGLHATETVGTHQLIETLYQLTSRDDEETLRILRNTIILLFHCNPDGHELVGNWYMQYDDPAKRNKNIPRLYHKYVGHDNNRDFYMNNLLETTTISRLQYIEWNPQIIYNHHQSGPPGSIVAGPPYRDPFNYTLDPLLITSIDAVGAAMINRVNAEGRQGYTRLSGSVFSTWWNGGLRTAPYFHNSVGILTEIVGDPTPMTIPVIPERLIPNNATPNPVIPRPWHFREAIDYSVSLNYAILDYASRFGDNLLYNMYRMGRNSIEKGMRDHWSLTPGKVSQITERFEKQKQANADNVVNEGYYGQRTNIPQTIYDEVFSDPTLRDPHGYIIPADQPDFPRAVAFINALIKSGIKVHRASAAFSVGGKSYPAGSYIVKTAQAFRPHVIDLFDPQDHPNDFQYPGGPPVRPYDAAGWTLAYQFGIDFDRILDPFDGPFEAVGYGTLQTPPAVSVTRASGGYLLDGRVNNAFIVANRLLNAGVRVFRITESTAGLPAGSFYVPGNAYAALQRAIDTLGVSPKPVKGRPSSTVSLKPARIALFDQYGGSMPSGWVRWLMEQYDYENVTVIYPKDIDAGNLNARFDIILFIGGGIPAVGSNSGDERMGRGRGAEADLVPETFHHMLGSVTTGTSIPKLKEFLEAGGRILTVGSSTSLAYHLGLPVRNALTETGKDGKERPLPGEKFYAPGSIHRVYADTTTRVAWGMPAEVDVMCSNSPVFRFADEALAAGLKKLAWYGEENPLRSGWIWGADYLKNGVTAFSAPVGKGMLYAFGPEITFRAQPHGTFKWLFNLLYETN